MTSLLNKLALLALLLSHFIMSAQVVDNDGIPVKPSPPKLVNDYAELLSISEREQLEQKLLAFNDSTSTQVCIVTVNSIGDYAIDDFAVRLGRKWGIGQKDEDNGLLITVAKEERKVDIEVGYGLESYITDYDSKEIIDDLLVPAFKQNNYYEGINKATDRIIAQLQGTYSGSPVNDTDKIPLWVIILIIILLLIIISSISSSRGSITASGGGWTWTGGGGSWSGGGGSSGGFGGFGGGSFGGGGSSGSW